MKLARAIEVDGLRLNPFTPEAAAFVVRAYDWWRYPQRRDAWNPPPGWDAEPFEWENVQLMVASRAIGAYDPLEGYAGLRRGARLRAVIVPGTNEAADWGANFNPWPMKIGGLPGRWRRGFALGGEWVWSKLEHAAGPHDALAIWGHSYGGSMTLDASAYALRDGASQRIVSSLGFAATRVTSKKGARALNQAFPSPVGQRLVMGFDMVPWGVLPFGWHHSLEPIFIGSDGRVHPKYRFGVEARAALQKRGLQAVGDHGMRNYESWARGLPPPSSSMAHEGR